MYRFIKGKRSVLSVTPVWNSFTHKFHVSLKKYVRGVRTTNSVVSGNHKDHTNPVFVLQDSSMDFLGIERDEGVITLKSRQNPLPQPIQKRKLKEKFHCTSFGVVRYDAENKLKFHGQYQSQENRPFPHKNNEYVEVSTTLLEFPNKSVNYSNTIRNNKEMSESSEPYLLEKKEQDESYIDDCYFSNVSEREKINSNADGSHTSSEKLSFLDETYFGTFNASEDVESSEYPALEDLKYPKDSTSEKERNETLTERQHLTKDVNFTQSTTQELNFFDENYFKTVTSESQQFSNSPNCSSDLPNAETIFGCNKKEISEVNNNEHFHINLIPDVTDDQKADSLPNDAATFVESNEILHEQVDGFNEVSLPNISNESSTESNKHVEVSNKDYGQKIKQDDFEYSNTSPDILNTDFLSKRKRQLLSNDTKADIHTVKSVARENNLKHSSQVSEEPDNVSTAHEFVEKLRKAQEIPQPNIKKEKDPKEEKYDSKGFRILTNQVDNLEYFTRDEILSLLKCNIVYSDDDLLILNKPYGLVIHDSKTTKTPCLSTFLDDLAKEMDRKSTDPKLFTVHRIDKETTGCLLLARNETMASHLKYLFAQRKIIKKYWIITTRVPDPPEGVIDIPIAEGSVNNKKRMVLHPEIPKDMPYRNHSKHGKQATTSYKVLLESGNAALVEAFPETGIKHQIRVHFGFGLSCPILGDHKYSHFDKLAPQKLPSDILQRLYVRQSKVRHIAMHIHAKCVIVPEYFKERNLVVNAPLPNHMKVNLKRLKFRKSDM